MKREGKQLYVNLKAILPPPPTNIIGRGKLVPSVPMSMALNMVGYGFDEGKRLTIRNLGHRYFGTE